MKYRSLNLLEPSGLHRACYGTHSSFTLKLIVSKRILDVIGTIAVGCRVHVGHTIGVTFTNLYIPLRHVLNTQLTSLFKGDLVSVHEK